MLSALDMHTITGTLTPRPPFDFAKTLGFLGAFSPTADEQTLAGATLTKAVTLHGRAIAFTLHNVGTVDAPQLAYTLISEQSISNAETAAMVDRIRFFLSLDDDLTPFYALGHADLAFSPTIERLYGLHQPKFLTPFEIACWAVLAQRIPMPIAHRIKLAMVQRWGTHITLPEGTHHAFPEPKQLAHVDPADLLAVVHNERKVGYLQAVTAFFQHADEQFLRTGDATQVAAQIRSIRGIGEWSTHFILVRGLGRMEQLSVADRELAKAAAILYNNGMPLTVDELQHIMTTYGLHQGYWAFYARNALGNRMPAPEG